VGQESPFIGPRPFEEDEAEIFFGRRNELSALAAQVVSTQIVLLYAASGSGKSSLISAGLIPALRSRGFKVAQERFNILASGGGKPPVDSLHEAIRHSAFRSPSNQPSLLVLDQFEEIIGALTYMELDALSDTVYDLMVRNPLARVVISFREEYLARVRALFNKPSEVSIGHFRLHRLSRPGAIDAFKRSLGTVRFQVGPEAEEVFLEKVAPPTRGRRSEVGFEPLYLQLLGFQLWSSIANRSPEPISQGANGLKDVPRVVTVADVRRLVDFDQAIEDFYNSTISRVCRSHHLTEKAMRDWIDRELVTPDETRSMVRRQADETNGLQTSALDDLVKRGLLRMEPRSEDLWLELAHDQLVERVREFNRIWWAGHVYTLLHDRNTRYDLAIAASRWDLQRWVQARTGLWSLSAAVRESGIQLSQRLNRWLPFAQKRSNSELDRLALRAFVLTGALINSAVYLYRSKATDVPETFKLTDVEGLDAEMAKRRLRATALNLGRTDQLLVVANVSAATAWARLLSRLLTRSVVGAQPIDWRRRWPIAVLVCADAVLTLLRWAVRNGLIQNCLDPVGQVQKSQVLGRSEAAVIQRCMSLEDMASWSRGHPVMLVLDWRSGVDSAKEFARFLNQEVSLYENALKTRGTTAVWCCRADLRRRGWRDGISGIGLPARGQRTYYMIENGNVVAWRTVKSYEFPLQLRANTIEEKGNSPQARSQEIKIEKQFVATLTSLIVSSEATPPSSWWHEWSEQYFKSGLSRRRSTDR
jgi:hypothetical protein